MLKTIYHMEDAEGYEPQSCQPARRTDKAVLASVRGVFYICCRQCRFPRRRSGRGVGGMLDLFSQKSAIDFGDGTYGAHDFWGINPERHTWVHDFVLENGRSYWLYSGYVTAVHITLMLFMLIGAYRVIAGGRETGNGSLLLPLYMAVFGVWLFLMSWETNQRYFSNFAPVIIAFGVLGMRPFRALTIARGM